MTIYFMTIKVWPLFDAPSVGQRALDEIERLQRELYADHREMQRRVARIAAKTQRIAFLRREYRPGPSAELMPMRVQP